MILVKIITSAITIVAITEITKKYCFLGGLIAVLPINIMLGLAFLYFEQKDMALLLKFTQSAFQNIFFTVFFLGFLVLIFDKYSRGMVR